MMYRVTWEIDIEAGTPRAAARAALEIQRRESSAVVFEVAAEGTVTHVDLADSNE